MQNTESKLKIVICGFMGSGKTTFAKKIKNNSSDCDFFDLDDEVLKTFAKSEGYESLGAYIVEKGWEAFRSNEKEKLIELLNNNDETILSLGGGALTEENLEIIKNSKNTQLLWMNTPFEECWRRIKDDPNRPLVKHGKNKVEDLYYAREPLYAQSDCNLNPAQQEKLTTLEELLDFTRKLDE